MKLKRQEVEYLQRLVMKEINSDKIKRGDNASLNYAIGLIILNKLKGENNGK